MPVGNMNLIDSPTAFLSLCMISTISVEPSLGGVNLNPSASSSFLCLSMSRVVIRPSLFDSRDATIMPSATASPCLSSCCERISRAWPVVCP